ncbi:DUF1178 family protein [Novosphingobium pentaromativorans]|uniref:Uncharacterized protein n=1 Tax=Novosphingobium pentaromativorans US6-1 TaxID=1088721 RepID=G6EIR3_9SPHN|nr:DUF1178 family protein [Novosphingobium pentaromativorans]AIT78879.1 hypothetical protein JI59_03130 [Novosphingobium pentaromativorans US6-1]EHJ59005.1 hypothetical protein NSU_4234 [Novosphingobium pentaromativorans US6-1]
MIVYDLECRSGPHRFEGWFKSSEDFARQQERGLVSCPHCGSVDVGKAIQAPRLSRKGNQIAEAPARPQPAKPAEAPGAPVASAPIPAEAVEVIRKLAQMQAEALKSSRYVGKNFAEDARAMHYGEREAEAIHGQTSASEAQELLEEGISLMPLPFPVTPPEQAN